MNEQGKIIPIGEGEIIQKERAMEKVKDIQDKALALYDRLMEVEKGKEKQLKDEVEKPLEEQDINLIALLTGDIEKLRKIENELDKTILESFEQQDALREHWLQLLERVETKGY